LKKKCTPLRRAVLKNYNRADARIAEKS
jgi:hypothetical protein